MRVAINFIEDHKLLDPDDANFQYIDNRAYRKDLPPGTAQWSRGTEGQIASLWFTCPCGCGMIGATTVNPDYGKCWEWDKNEEKPSLSPSIQLINGCRWHGYLKRGLFGLTVNPEQETP
jgi:hypothetical protein